VRAAVALADEEALNPNAVAYLNRLSDLMFILARGANADAGGDVLWVPGGDGSSPTG
jgi:cob(I)alamin adenosyltransferase